MAAKRRTPGIRVVKNLERFERYFNTTDARGGMDVGKAALLDYSRYSLFSRLYIHPLYVSTSTHDVRVSSYRTRFHESAPNVTVATSRNPAA
jgi:hypothetical protein